MQRAASCRRRAACEWGELRQGSGCHGSLPWPPPRCRHCPRTPTPRRALRRSSGDLASTVDLQGRTASSPSLQVGTATCVIRLISDAFASGEVPFGPPRPTECAAALLAGLDRRIATRTPRWTGVTRTWQAPTGCEWSPESEVVRRELSEAARSTRLSLMSCLSSDGVGVAAAAGADHHAMLQSADSLPGGMGDDTPVERC